MANEKVIDVTGSSGKKLGGIIVLIFIIVVLGLTCFTTVKSGHTGVVTTFGKVSDGVLAEGLHVKIPFVQRVIQIDNRVKKAEALCSSASKDLQTVESTIAVNYKIMNSSSSSLYKNIGTDYESIIITPAIQECVKAVSAQFTAEELVSSRQNVSDLMSEQLKSKVNSYGIEIQNFNIISFDFTAEYNQAIEAKQTAQQEALKAEQDLLRIEVEAEQTITAAQAEAEAYRLKSQELTPEILLMNYIEKWDGKLPTVASGDGGTMMIDITELLSQIEDKTPAPVQQAPAPVVSIETETVE